jgi:predicted RNase H-like nuclease
VRHDPGAPTAETRYVGIDLAWGARATTGLAVLDEAGDLLDVSAARSDEQVQDWLGRWAPGPCLVAIDAPLIVRNASGRRTCETLVTRHFARFHAGCHSSNTAMAHFADGGRALRLAGAAGLDMDPTSTADRRAIEVYPHPALVSLFDLPRILRYKSKPGRDLGLRRGELTRLLDLLEDLEQARPRMRVRRHPGWRDIRAAVAGAIRKADLDRVEDSVDAVVCAYVGLHFDGAPARRRVLGSFADGYIVTPVTPGMGAAIDADGLGGVHPEVRRAAQPAR